MKLMFKLRRLIKQSSHIPAGFQILTTIPFIFHCFCGIVVLSLIALSLGIENEVLAQIGSSSGYEFVTKWGTQGEEPGQFDGQNDVVP
jgi:hypothetical protein